MCNLIIIHTYMTAAFRTENGPLFFQEGEGIISDSLAASQDS